MMMPPIKTLLHLLSSRETYVHSIFGFLAARAGILDGLHPFGAALFVALLVGGDRKRSAAVSMSVILGSLTSLPLARTAAMTLFVFLFIILRSSHHEMEKDVRHPTRGRLQKRQWQSMMMAFGLFAACRLLFQLPIGMTDYDLINIFVESLLVTVLSFLLLPLAGFAWIRPMSDFDRGRWVAVALLATAAGLGLHTVELGWIRPVEIWIRWMTMLAALIGHAGGGASVGTLFTVLLSLAGELPLGGRGLYGVAGLFGGLAGKSGKVGVALGFLVGQMLVSVLATSADDISLGMAHTGLAVILVALTPDRWISKLARNIPGTRSRAELDFAREERLFRAINDKMHRLSTLFLELSSVLSVNGTTVEKGLNEDDKGVHFAKRIVPRQLTEIAELIQNAAAHVRHDADLAETTENYLKNEPGLRLIDGVDVKVMRAGEYPEIEVVYDGDCDGYGQCEEKIKAALERATEKSYSVQTSCRKKGQHVCTLRLIPVPPFYVDYDVCHIVKDRRSISGDTFVRFDLDDGQVALLMSDGMGVGKVASLQSRSAVSLLEKMIRAGFDRAFAVQTVNAVLVMRSEVESFATVDLALVDTYTGEAQFIKSGSSSTFIRRRNGVDVIRSRSLPIGIIGGIDVTTEKAVLSPDDVIVMTTDGLLDHLPAEIDKEEWMIRLLKRESTKSPEQLGSIITERAHQLSSGGVKDDVTVVIARIVRRRLREGDIPEYFRTAMS